MGKWAVNLCIRRWISNLFYRLWGNPSHMEYMESQLSERIHLAEGEEMIVYKTGSHSGFLTYDGIDVNGKRISDEIFSETARLNSLGGKVTKITIVGYSLGGLISRYAIGILCYQGYFKEVSPVNFVTFCSPHVGVLSPGFSILKLLFNNIVPHLLAHSGAQMFLKDKTPIKANQWDGNTKNLPLLVWMADPTSVFFRALEQFKHRALYSNVINDRRTSWFTSGISLTDPFHFIDANSPGSFDFDYVNGYLPNIIDYNKPITFRKVEEPSENFVYDTSSRISNFIYRKLKWFKVIANAVIFTPVWALCLVATSIMERIRLNKRVGGFFKETSLLHLYCFDLSELLDPVPSGDPTLDNLKEENFIYNLERGINNHVVDQTDDFVEAIYDSMDTEKFKDYHYDILSKETEISQEQKDSTSGFTTTLDEMADYKEPEGLCDRLDDKGESNVSNINDFALELSEAQQFIIHNLNSIEWEKFPVIIRNTKATHAAAIVRQDIPMYEEGKRIIDHFVSETFKLT